jgi:hypothetical protein
MKRNATIFAALLTALLALTLVACTPGVVQSDARATSKALPDQWEFPASVGQFKRGKVDYTGSGDTRQVTAAYSIDQPSLQVAMVVDVYRFKVATGTTEQLSIDQQFDRERNALFTAHGMNVTLPPATAGTIKPAGREHPGLASKFTFQEPFNGRVTEMDSHIYYFREGDWSVRYRISFPSTVRPQAEVALADFMSHLAWP